MIFAENEEEEGYEEEEKRDRLGKTQQQNF